VGVTPRLILKNQLDRLEERGLTYKVGVEAEYFLVSRQPNGQVRIADPLDTASSPCYDVKALTRMFPHLARVSKYCNQLGWSNYANDHEDANGQFEQNFAYADALTSADRLIFFRYMVHTLAHEAGMAATFMPKVFSDRTGNGLHMHSSLWHGDEQLFVDDADPRGLGMSSLGYSFVAGLVEHARASVAVTCPTVNSYKRMGVGAPASGATWAPAYATYGGNNRTQMLRIPDGGRVEHRGCDGSANPYLALTVMLAAGLDGVDRELDPGEPNRDNLYTLTKEQVAERGLITMPPTLLHATEALVEDHVLREALGKGAGGDYIDYFADVKRREFLDYHSVVSDWEVDRYLTLF
jgi:glutamine synthetase